MKTKAIKKKERLLIIAGMCNGRTLLNYFHSKAQYIRILDYMGELVTIECSEENLNKIKEEYGDLYRAVWKGSEFEFGSDNHSEE